MAGNETEYRGYRLVLQAVGSGWRVLIHPPGESVPLPQVPTTPNMFDSAKVMGDARKIVDDILASNP
jgi:hypothetical protein